MTQRSLRFHRRSARVGSFATLILALTSCGGGSGAGTATATSNSAPSPTPPAAADPTPPPTAPTARPNILLIISDDIGAEASSVGPALAGASGAVASPNLERLAANGLSFDNAWATPLCSPTRAAMLTGRYGNRTGVTNVGDTLPTSTTSLFELITAQSPARYDMALFGKWHLGGPVGSIQHVRDSGVPAYRGLLGGAVSNYFNWSVADSSGTTTTSTVYATTAITDFTLSFIRNHRATRPDEPWFAWVAYNAAHDPNQVPPASLHSVNVGGLAPGTVSNTLPVYKAAIQSMDTEIGRLLAEVDLATTTVIYVGDNGTPANVKDVGSRVRGSKQSVYEGGVRVPLVIAGANVTRRGRESSLVTATDLFATIAALSGITASSSEDSYSLVPLLGDANGRSGRTHSFTELCVGGVGSYAIRDARYKMLYTAGVWALYDLQEDPLEASNVYADGRYASQRASLQSALDVIKARATAGCFI